jgi:hypothetical protein
MSNEVNPGGEGLDLEAAIRQILVEVRRAASGYHNSQRWGEAVYGDLSYWDKIKQTEGIALSLAAQVSGGEGAPAAIEYKQSPWSDVRMQRQDGKPGCETCAGNGWITIRERTYRCQECAPAVPDALAWTREAPAVEGWYFLRMDKWPRYYFPAYVRAMAHDSGILFFVEQSTEDCVTNVEAKGIKGEWSSLLPEPREAPPAPMNEGEVK